MESVVYQRARASSTRIFFKNCSQRHTSNVIFLFQDTTNRKNRKIFTAAQSRHSKNVTMSSRKKSRISLEGFSSSSEEEDEVQQTFYSERRPTCGNKKKRQSTTKLTVSNKKHKQRASSSSSSSTKRRRVTASPLALEQARQKIKKNHQLEFCSSSVIKESHHFFAHASDILMVPTKPVEALQMKGGTNPVLITGRPAVLSPPPGQNMKSKKQIMRKESSIMNRYRRFAVLLFLSLAWHSNSIHSVPAQFETRNIGWKTKSSISMAFIHETLEETGTSLSIFCSISSFFC